jgi:Na+/H+ antiporter NhaD/arsenite permease-like protein
MLKIDWKVILIFMGLFVWLQGFQNTCFPNEVFYRLKNHIELNTVSGVLLFSIFIIVGSNVLSNVPLVILFAD